jgi:hypothetical protein
MKGRIVGGSLLAAVCLLCVAGVASSSSGSTKNRRIVIYSLATEEQFVNNADDRQRGQGNNPFGNYKDLTATTKKKGNGPFPGDEALFEFDLYSNANLKTHAGTAVFTCLYNFKKNAYCAATYTLKGGTLVGAGPLDFNAPKFQIAITGGTGSFRSATGDVEASPVLKNHAQPLAITLD